MLNMIDNGDSVLITYNMEGDITDLLMSIKLLQADDYKIDTYKVNKDTNELTVLFEL